MTNCGALKISARTLMPKCDNCDRKNGISNLGLLIKTVPNGETRFSFYAELCEQCERKLLRHISDWLFEEMPQQPVECGPEHAPQNGR